MDPHLPYEGQALLDDARRAEVLASLNELLETERAGARVAMETDREVQATELAALVDAIHKDEARWCGMRMRTIKSLGATPSSSTGAFHGKAWVVRKLEALIPRMPDAAHRAELQTMLDAHRRNIDLVESRLSGGSTPGSAPAPRDAHPTQPQTLIEHTLPRFHEGHRRQFPELIDLATKVETVHADRPDALRGVAALLLQIHSELLDHMCKEEGVLFPMLARGGNPSSAGDPSLATLAGRSGVGSAE